MKTTLIVENNSEIESYLSLNLHTWLGTEIITKKSAKFAIEYLQENPNNVHLIITKGVIITERTAEALAQFLQTSKSKVPLIVLGDTALDVSNYSQYDSALDIKPIIQGAAKYLNVTAKEMANKVVPDYFPIPIQFFNYLTAPVAKVFEQDLENENNFNICLEEYQDFPKELIKKFSAEGTTQLFVKKNDRLKFVTNITQEIASKLQFKDLNNDEQVKALELSQELLHQKIARLGITEETVELSRRNMKLMAKSAKSNVSLMRLIKRLMKNKAGYLFKHSQVLTFVTTHLMENLDWGNKEQVEKIQFISFFHDIALEDDEQAKIHSEAALKNSDLPSNKKELVKKHAQLAATLISSYPKAPMGSEMIIKQHHGIPHGIGFSEHFGANLSPMTIVFILAEDFVDEIIQSGTDFDLTQKILQMKQKYSTQRFQKIIEVLEKISL